MVEFINEKLKDKIEKVISDSLEIKIVTAFLKKSGLDIFKIINHNKVSVICGIDFFITEPDALKYLENKNFQIKIFHEPKKTFHPKCIYVKTIDKEYLVVGSSNITFGGLSNNYEVSILLDNDFTNQNVFINFNKYFNNLLSSKYCIGLNHQIFMNYSEKYNDFCKNKENFDKEIEDKFYNNDKPVTNLADLSIDDWVYHDDFGLGRIEEKNEANIDVFFIERGSMKIGISNKLNKIFTFDSKLLDKYFEIKDVNSLSKIIDEYRLNGKRTLEERDIFYQKWKPCLMNEMSSTDIYNFFEESSKIWTLMMLKKNILSGDVDEFNDYMKILNNNNLSILKRFEFVCNKAKSGKIFSGISYGITSLILSILYPTECIVYNNASKGFLEYFNIKMQKSNSKKQTNKYFQYSLFGKILKEKYNFRDLVEVDCFIGFVKVNYFKK
ncbi:phospholipase D-like domain-containing protein [Treponema sp. R6D11]